MSKQPDGRKRAEKVKQRAAEKKHAEQRLNQAARAKSVRGELAPLDDIEPFDRRLMEREMARLIGGEATAGTSAKLQQAQELTYQAMEAPTPDKARKLAHQALKICPDCADAHVLLAELAASVSDALALYEQGVAAGRRSLAKEWEEIQGHFWDYLPTRPFLRAMQGQADCLWGIGRRDESIATYLEMLTLNPDDNQGIRDIVMPLLLEMGRLDECRKLLDQYSGDSCFSMFNGALWEFRNSGDSPAARKALQAAAKTNAYVVEALLRNRPQLEPVDSYNWGSPEEARVYMDLGARAWRTTPGALAWLRKLSAELPESSSLQRTTREREVEQAELAKSVGRLPLVEDDVWEIHLVSTEPADPDEPEDVDVPVAALHIWSRSDDLPLATEFFDDASPTFDELCEAVLRCCLTPQIGSPRRPGCCEFLDDGLCSQLKEPLGQFGIRAELAADADERLAAMDELLEAQRNQVTFQGPLSELPVADDEAWLIGTRQLDIWVPNESGESCRPWVWLVVSPQDGTVVYSDMSTEPLTAEKWNENLEAAMRGPMVGEPRRPHLAVVRVADHRAMLDATVSGGLVNCVVFEDFSPWDAVADMMAATFSGRRPGTPYVEVPGLSREQLASFFEASADFFRQAPWQFTPADSIWKVEPFDRSSAPWWAVVLGQNGETFGLALYDDWNCLIEMMTGQMTTGPEVIGTLSAMCLNYEEAPILSGEDLDAIDQFGWDIPTPEAYPLVYRAKLGTNLETPTADEFLWLEAVLRTLPTFIRSDKKTGTLTAKQLGQSCKLRYSRVPPDACR